jgi:hypothetical protein
MANTWLEIFLGKIGTYIYIFFSRYYYYIIPLIMAYGILMALSSYNFRRIEKRVDLEILNQSKKILVEAPDINYVDLVERIRIPWKKIINTCSFFPYMSQRSGLWVRKTNPLVIRDTIMQDEKKIKLVLERNGIYNFMDRSKWPRNLYTESIHRITRRKDFK